MFFRIQEKEKGVRRVEWYLIYGFDFLSYPLSTTYRINNHAICLNSTYSPPQLPQNLPPPSLSPPPTTPLTIRSSGALLIGVR